MKNFLKNATKIIVAGTVIGGLGYAAWNYFGEDTEVDTDNDVETDTDAEVDTEEAEA